MPRNGKISYDDILLKCVGGCVSGACFFSIGPLNDNIFRFGGLAVSDVQQYITIAFWSIAGALSLLAFRSDRFYRPSLVVALFYLYASFSGSWAHDPIDGLTKGAILLYVSLMIYLTSLSIDVKIFMRSMKLSAILLCLISWPIAIFRPDLGVSYSFYHTGAWEGVFNSKQALGISGAIVIFGSISELLARDVRKKFSQKMVIFVTLLLGAATCFLSESRGAAFVVLFCVFLIYAGNRFIELRKISSLIPVMAFTFSSISMAWLVLSNSNHYQLGSLEINLTQRTYIWNHALTLWIDRPLLGFGINGFWNIEEVSRQFELQYGWIIPNFHSGYVAILTELGLVGYIIFAIVTMIYSSRLFKVASYLSEDSLTRMITLGVPLIIYSLNLTETFFARSTNFINCLFLFMMLQTTRVLRAK